MSTAAQQRRADELEEKILARIADGKFKLESGYLRQRPVYQNGIVTGTKICQGCALAAAACAISGGRMTDGDQRRCADLVTTELHRTEAAQLEMGYEHWIEVEHAVPTGKDGDEYKFRYFKAEPDHPFYKLGQKLRNRRFNFVEV